MKRRINKHYSALEEDKSWVLGSGLDDSSCSRGGC